MSATKTAKVSADMRKLTGTVVSTKMSKTIVVRVDRNVRHPKYGKIYTVSRKYHAHDEKAVAKPGDIVEIIAARPLSATKRWRYFKTVKAAPVAPTAADVIETETQE